MTVLHGPETISSEQTDIMKMTLKQIQVFIAIAKIENITQAADTLFLTQSACSMALTNLEEQLGIELFERRGKKLILNDKGKLLLPKAVNIIQAVEEAQALILSSEDRQLVGQLIIGASSTIGNYILPKIIGNFANEHVKTKLTLQVGNTEKIIHQLLKFNIDIGMIEGHCYDPHIKVIPWKQDELVLIASPKHPLCSKKKITLDDLKIAPWILREPGSGTREKIEEIMGSQLNIFLELGHTEAIKQAVIDGFGITCLSKATVQQALKNQELIVLKTPFLKLNRQFYILLHTDKQETELLKSFLEYCCNRKSLH